MKTIKEYLNSQKVAGINESNSCGWDGNSIYGSGNIEAVNEGSSGLGRDVSAKEVMKGLSKKNDKYSERAKKAILNGSKIINDIAKKFVMPKDLPSLYGSMVDAVLDFMGTAQYVMVSNDIGHVYMVISMKDASKINLKVLSHEYMDQPDINKTAGIMRYKYLMGDFDRLDKSEKKVVYLSGVNDAKKM